MQSQHKVFALCQIFQGNSFIHFFLFKLDGYYTFSAKKLSSNILNLRKFGSHCLALVTRQPPQRSSCLKQPFRGRMCRISEHSTPALRSFNVALFWFLTTTLLKFNLHTIKITLVKQTFQWFLVQSPGCATVTALYFQNIHITTKGTPHPLAASPVPQPLAATDLSVSVLCLFWTLQTWNHTIYVISFTQHNAFQVYRCCCVYQYSPPFAFDVSFISFVFLIFHYCHLFI